MRVTIFLIILLSLFYSCEDEIDMNLTLKEKKIVINTFFNNEEYFHVNLSSNQVSTDGDTVLFINNANVMLYENDTFLDTLSFTENGNYVSNKVIPKAGIPYNLKAEVPGLKTAITKDAIIPEAIESYKLDTLTYYDSLTDKIFRQVNIKFKDIENVANYYMIYMIWEGTRYSYDNNNNCTDSMKTKVAYGWGDGILIPAQGKFMFTDEFMEGDTIEKNMYFRMHMPHSGLGEFDNLKAWFKLCTISEEYYLYAKSIVDQNNSLDFSMFVEPVTVYSNIINGEGIFAGYGQCVDSVFYRE